MLVLDLIILLFLAMGAWRGYKAGLIQEVAQLVGVLFAFLLAVRLMDPVGEAVAASVKASPAAAPLIGFVVTFLAVLLGVFFVARTVERVVSTLKLSTLNQAVGGFLGAFKAGLILSILFVLAARFSLLDGLAAGSALYAPVAELAPGTWDVVTAAWPEVEGLAEKLGDDVEQQLEERNVDG